MDNATDEDFTALSANIKEMRRVQDRCQRGRQAGCRVPQADRQGGSQSCVLLAKEPSGMLVRPVTAFIISKNPRGIPQHYRSASEHPRCPAASRQGSRPSVVNRHLNDWKVGFELSGHEPRQSGRSDHELLHCRRRKSSSPRLVSTALGPTSIHPWTNGHVRCLCRTCLLWMPA